MLNELIKTEINTQVDKRLMESSIEKIILNAQYHCLPFAGLATTAVSVLTPRFNMDIVRNKNILIKGFQVIPYCDGNVIDFSFSDGTTETLPANTRLLRSLDQYSASMNLRVFINGAYVDIFPEDPAGAGGGLWWLPIDLKVDGLYYKYKDKVDAIAINAGATVLTDFNNTGDVLLVVLMECYTY